MKNTIVALMVLGGCVAQSTMEPGHGPGSGSGTGSGTGTGSGAGSGTGSGSGSGTTAPAPLPSTAFAFVHAEGTSNDAIYVYDLATGAARGLGAVGESLHGVAISPDRTRIAYATDDALYEVGVDGSNPHRLSAPITPPAGEHVVLDLPEYSPDGTTIYVGLGLWSDTSYTGGTALAVMPATGGQIEFLQPAMDHNCSVITAPKFSPDGSWLAVVHDVCVDSTTSGQWRHAPDGTGALLAHLDFALTKPVILGDGSLLAVGLVVSGANGLVVVQNGQVTGTQAPPQGTSLDALAAPADGSVLVVERHDLTTLGTDLFVTTDGTTYAQVTSDGKSSMPSF